MLRVKLPVVDRIQPQSNKFAVGEENKAIGDSKLNDSPLQWSLLKLARGIGGYTKCLCRNVGIFSFL